MNLMKKLIVALLVLATVLTFAACTDEKKDNDDNDKNESTQSEVSTEASAEESTEESTEESSEAPVDEAELLIGTWEGEFNAISIMELTFGALDMGDALEGISITDLPMAITLEIDETDLKMSMAATNNDVWVSYLTELYTAIYDSYVASGMIPESVTIEDFMAQMGSIEDIVASMSNEQTFEYTYEDGAFTFDGEDAGVEATITASAMTWEIVDQEAAGLPIDSIEFTKAN